MCRDAARVQGAVFHTSRMRQEAADHSMCHRDHRYHQVLPKELSSGDGVTALLHTWAP